MAIAKDSSAGGNNAAVTSLTVSLTTSGSNRALFAYVETENAGGEKITVVTYAGIAMTQLRKQDFQASDGSWHYIYGLLNPAVGANDIVVSVSSSSIINLAAISYTGVPSQALPDASNSAVNTGVSSISTSITTIANNCWIFAGCYMGGGTSVVASTNLSATNQQSSGNDHYAAIDTNGVITPAGATTIAITNNPVTAGAAMIMGVSFSPTGTQANAGFLYNMI